MTSATLFISIFEKMGLWGTALSVGGTPHGFLSWSRISGFCGEADPGRSSFTNESYVLEPTYMYVSRLLFLSLPCFRRRSRYYPGMVLK